jgi:hypothetical protein
MRTDQADFERARSTNDSRACWNILVDKKEHVFLSKIRQKMEIGGIQPSPAHTGVSNLSGIQVKIQVKSVVVLGHDIGEPRQYFRAYISTKMRPYWDKLYLVPHPQGYGLRLFIRYK